MVEVGRFADFVDGLWTAIRGRQVAIFCGAGVSLRSGLPLVPDFMSTVLELLGAIDEDRRSILNSPLPFEAFVEVLENYSDISPLLSIFDLGAPNATHLFLAELARAGYVRTLCTTNFDALIEKALEQVGLARDEDFGVLYRNEDFGRVGSEEEKIHVVKVHGSVDDKAGMAITLAQVAASVLSEGRRQVMDSIFAGGSHRAVLVLGYSCSDLFDLSPHIESISASHRRIILVDHKRDMQEVRDLADRQEKNPFRGFPTGDWVLCDTDALLASLRAVGGLPAPPPPAPGHIDPPAWKDGVSTWARMADEKCPGLTAPSILGELLFKISRFERSAQHYERALAIARVSGDRQREGIYLGNLANNEYALGRTELAIEHSEAAISIARELGDEQREGMWLGNHGAQLIDAGDRGRAIELLQQARSIAARLGDRSSLAYCLSNLGRALYWTGRYEEAAAQFREAIVILRDIGDKKAEATSIGGLGDALHRLGRYAEAIAHHEQALEHADRLADRESALNWHARIADDYLALGEIARAHNELKLAIPLADFVGDPRNQAARLADLGNVYWAAGMAPEARKLYERALAIARKSGHARLEASTLGNLGNLLALEGHHDQAIECYEHALEIAELSHDLREQAVWLSNLGTCHYRARDYEGAVTLELRSLAVASSIGEARLMGDASLNLGWALRELGETQKAAGYFRQALKIFAGLFGRDHHRTRLARNALDKLEPLLQTTLYRIEQGDKAFALYTASGQRMVPVCAKLETARRVRQLLADRFPGDMQIVGLLGASRESLEEAARAKGVSTEGHLLVYEDTPEFALLLAALEAYPTRS